MAVPWLTGCRSTKNLHRVFVDLSGKPPPSAAGMMFLMMVADDFSRLDWSYFLKKSYTAFVFAKCLADIRADCCSSVVERVNSGNDSEFLSAEFVA